MLRSLLHLRTNPAILFVGAFAVIFLIKATTLLLPSQYYFSFSKLVAGDRGPFLVDPPSVSGKKMCGLLKKYGVTAEDIQAGQVNCSLGKVASKTASAKAGKANFSNKQIDFIYRTALASDGAILQGGKKILSTFKFQPMNEQQLESLVQDNPTVTSAHRKISAHYVNQLNSKLNGPIRAYLSKKFETFEDAGAAANQPGQSAPKFAPLADADRAKLKQTSIQIATELNRQIGQLNLANIEKSQVDDVLDKAYGKWDTISGITGFYGDQAQQWTNSKVTKAFSAAGLDIQDADKAKKLIFTEMSNQGLNDYVISVALRIAPVLLFGLILGFLFGPREFLSIGLAAGLAAFLLSWPLMLLWESLVGHQWQDQKAIFLVFYAIYALSFFVTAHFAAVVGAYIRTLFAGSQVFMSSSGGDQVQRVVGWRDLAFNLIAGLAVNGVVYAWNVIIPLTAT